MALSDNSIHLVTEHARNHEHIKVVIAETLRPGYVSCIGPVRTICAAEILCRPEDYREVHHIISDMRASLCPHTEEPTE